MSLKNFYIFLTHFGVSQSNTPFTFSSFILILSGPIIIPKNPTSLTFYLHFSSFIYRLFAANLFTTSSTTLCSSSSSIPIIISLMNLTISPVLIKFCEIFFIIIRNIARELVSPNNITIGSNDSSGVVNTAFHSSSSFICTLLYLYCKFNFVDTFFSTNIFYNFWNKR